MTTFVVVTGTDTGVGKTFATAALARGLRSRGVRVVALKPIETGCGDDVDPNEDGVVLATAAGQDAPRKALLRLRDPLTPALAAEREGVRIDLVALANALRAGAAQAELALVEGAGGVASPITWEEDITYFARALSARVLLIGSDRLGVLGHMRLAIESIASRGVDIAGVVLSEQTRDSSTGTNADALRRMLSRRPDVAARIVCLGRDARTFDAVDLDRLLGWLATPVPVSAK